MKKHIAILLFATLVLCPSSLLFSQANQKSVYLPLFLPYKSEKNSALADKIFLAVESNFKKSGYTVIKGKSNSLAESLENSKKENAYILVDGFYKKSGNGNLSIYGQIYNPETGFMIDALNVTDEVAGIEGIKLDQEENKTTEEQSINEFTKKLLIRVRTNLKKAERRENILEAIQSTSIGKDISFPIRKEDLKQAGADVFKLLAEKEDVVVSVSKFAQKTSEAPADVTLISREQIRRSGFRNLNEALNFVPQVYSHYVGQNWSADFRGLFVNNQVERRVLYLQDGKKLNDYFHFGDFYSDIYTDMERIERIEVIKGPGAALYGNNSLTGVVNIVTRKPTKKNEMELVTEYDSKIQNLTTRALYYSKFSDDFSVALDMSKFEGKGSYDTGYDSWGTTRYYDMRADSISYTSEFGRRITQINTQQRIWTSTNSDVSNGRWFPNFNLDVNYKDLTLKAFYMSKRTTWAPPQLDGGNFGGDTAFGSPRNDRIWGTGVIMLDYAPSILKNYDASFRIFRQLVINSDFRDKDYEGYSNSNAPCVTQNTTTCSATPTASQKFSNPAFRAHVLANGGGLVKAYSSTAYTNGMEFQITPFKIETPQAALTNLRYMVGGNAQENEYINYQSQKSRYNTTESSIYINNGTPRYNQGIGDDGKQLGVWNQLTGSFKSGTSLVLGLRYDYQKVNRVYRHQNGNEADVAIEGVTDPITQSALTSAVNDRAGNRTLKGYSQPFQRKNAIAQDKTPRLAVIQEIKPTNTTLKFLYAEAFRMVTPQELIRLPRELGNAQSEKIYNYEVNLIQSFLKNQLTFTAVGFRMKGSTIYAFNAATASFGQSPGWSNEGGSLAMNYLITQDLRLSGSFTSYKLRRASDASFLNVLFTPDKQALNSPTKLWKSAISKSILGDKYSISLEYYYNSEIYLMENPPKAISQTINSDGTFREAPPLPNEAETKPGTSATAINVFRLNSSVGSGIARYRVWKVPASRFFNLTFSSNIGNDLILVMSMKNIFNHVVYYPLDIDSGSFTSPMIDPHQLVGFGRELYFKLGYRF